MKRQPPRRLPAAAVMIAGNRAKRLQAIGAELAAGVERIRDARGRCPVAKENAVKREAAPILIAVDPEMSGVDFIRRLNAGGLKLTQDSDNWWLKLVRKEEGR